MVCKNFLHWTTINFILSYWSCIFALLEVLEAWDKKFHSRRICILANSLFSHNKWIVRIRLKRLNPESTKQKKIECLIIKHARTTIENITQQRLVFRSTTWRCTIHSWLHFFIGVLDGNRLPQLLRVGQIDISVPCCRSARLRSEPETGRFTLYIEGARRHDRNLCSWGPQGEVLPYRCSFPRVHFGPCVSCQAPRLD